jgi:hypothetical protein
MRLWMNSGARAEEPDPDWLEPLRAMAISTKKRR